MTSITLFFIFIPFLAMLLLVINFTFAPNNPYQEKDNVFECGFHSFLGQNRTQFAISFFIFALLFLLFDLEILLVYPYIVSAYVNDIYGLIIMLIFFLLLTLGFAFELGKNALKIDSKQIYTIFNKPVLAMSLQSHVTHMYLNLEIFKDPDFGNVEIYAKKLKLVVEHLSEQNIMIGCVIFEGLITILLLGLILKSNPFTHLTTQLTAYRQSVITAAVVPPPVRLVNLVILAPTYEQNLHGNGNRVQVRRGSQRVGYLFDLYDPTGYRLRRIFPFRRYEWKQITLFGGGPSIPYQCTEIRVDHYNARMFGGFQEVRRSTFIIRTPLPRRYIIQSLAGPATKNYDALGRVKSIDVKFLNIHNLHDPAVLYNYLNSPNQNLYPLLNDLNNNHNLNLNVNQIINNNNLNLNNNVDNINNLNNHLENNNLINHLDNNHLNNHLDNNHLNNHNLNNNLDNLNNNLDNNNNNLNNNDPDGVD